MVVAVVLARMPHFALREQDRKFRSAISRLARKPCTVEKIKEAIYKAVLSKADDVAGSEAVVALQKVKTDGSPLYGTDGGHLFGRESGAKNSACDRHR